MLGVRCGFEKIRFKPAWHLPHSRGRFLYISIQRQTEFMPYNFSLLTEINTTNIIHSYALAHQQVHEPLKPALHSLAHKHIEFCIELNFISVDHKKLLFITQLSSQIRDSRTFLQVMNCWAVYIPWLCFQFQSGSPRFEGGTTQVELQCLQHSIILLNRNKRRNSKVTYCHKAAKRMYKSETTA